MSNNDDKTITINEHDMLVHEISIIQEPDITINTEDLETPTLNNLITISQKEIGLENITDLSKEIDIKILNFYTDEEILSAIEILSDFEITNARDAETIATIIKKLRAILLMLIKQGKANASITQAINKNIKKLENLYADHPIVKQALEQREVQEGEEVTINQDELLAVEIKTADERNQQIWASDRRLAPLVAQIIDEIYTENIENSPIHLKHHYRQKHCRAGRSTCSIASTRNAFKALEIMDVSSLDDDELIRMMDEYLYSIAINKKEAMHVLTPNNGFTNFGEWSIALEMFRNRGLKLDKLYTFTDVIEALSSGAMIISNHNLHTVLISGMEKRNGQLYFRVNDPLSDTMELKPLTDHMFVARLISNVFALYNTNKLEIAIE